eukprot:TRINITY_DN10173_c0_g1_i1.p1 TRINITY_DN10173_c0_g1~~TRINITY_DN10173_c0_g1_i1.p1  ORF type:complete len:105 (+),score=8.52 TRINITY_DN10173_c0_g1_i1:66-380(+)
MCIRDRFQSVGKFSTSQTWHPFTCLNSRYVPIQKNTSRETLKFSFTIVNHDTHNKPRGAKREIDKQRQKAKQMQKICGNIFSDCLLYTSPSPRDGLLSRMPSSA